MVLLALLLVAAYPYSFDQVSKIFQVCDDEVLSCEYGPFDDASKEEEDMVCARDLYKARTCWTSYKQCLPDSLDDTNFEEVLPVPLRCPSSAGCASSTAPPSPRNTNHSWRAWRGRGRS
jgi:hypothetical protein